MRRRRFGSSRGAATPDEEGQRILGQEQQSGEADGNRKEWLQMVKNGDQRRWMFCWRKETATVAKEKRAADCIVMLGGSTTS